jgi:DNA invertase Pin-like site-specific DNA recombinase
MDMAQGTRVAIYLRVGADGQATGSQRRELRAAAKRCGWRVVGTFVDEPAGGAGRPGLEMLLLAAARKDFDLVAACSVERLGRSLPDLVAILARLRAKGVGLYLHREGLDATTPAGAATLQALEIAAQLDRAMIRERVNAGLARARARGKRPGRPKVALAVERRVRDSLSKGAGILKTARTLGLGTRTVQRIKDEMAQTPSRSRLRTDSSRR